MMTQTHLLVAGAVFTRPKHFAINTAAIIGSLLPDVTLYGLFIHERIKGTSPETIFQKLYWSPEWQAMLAPANSFVIFAVVAIIGMALAREEGRNQLLGRLIATFAIAALMHLALDFPFHAADAYSHFWPITNWKFISPVSYWDHQHYGYFVQPLELMLGAFCLWLLYRRFNATWIKAVLAVCLAAYILVPVSFALLPGQLAGT